MFFREVMVRFEYRAEIGSEGYTSWRRGLCFTIFDVVNKTTSKDGGIVEHKATYYVRMVGGEDDGRLLTQKELEKIVS